MAQTVEAVIVREQVIYQPEYIGSIQITVQQPFLDQSEAFSFFVYPISGSDMHGPFSIRRRYSDFDVLRKRLTERWMGIYVPPISGKRSDNDPLYIFKIFQGQKTDSEQRYALTRQRFLNYFCAGLAAKPYLFYCDLFQQFIRGTSQYQTSIKAILVKEHNFLMNAYRNNFKTLMRSLQSVEFQAQWSLSEQHLKSLVDSQAKLRIVSEQIFKGIKARNQFNNQFNVCMESVIPEYEQTILLGNVAGDRQQLILNTTEEFSLKMAAYKTETGKYAIQGFLQIVAYQIRETKAFIEAIDGRRSAQRRRKELAARIFDRQNELNNLSNGKFSFKSIFKTGSKELQAGQIQVKIDSLKNEDACLQKMIEIMVGSTNYELEKYRIRRGAEYGQVFRSIAASEEANIILYNGLLQLILKGL